MTETAVPSPPQRRVSLLIWRREIEAEVDELLETVAVVRPASPPEWSQPYWAAVNADIGIAANLADRRIAAFWPRCRHELAVLWTGSEPQAARAALHRADENLFMVAPDDWVRAEAGSITALKATDVAKGPYADLASRLAGTWTVTPGDRELLRRLRHDDNAQRETARHRVLILRNILTCGALLLLVILAGVAWWAASNPALLPLRPAPPKGQPWGRPADVLAVEVMGALGGLVSSVVAIRSMTSFRRNYGLPLAQSLLKVPMGAAVALIAVFLVQQQVFSALKPIDWAQIPAYALVFGFAQLAVTRAIDTKANDLAGQLSAATRTATPSSAVPPADGGAAAAAKPSG